MTGLAGRRARAYWIDVDRHGREPRLLRRGARSRCARRRAGSLELQCRSARRWSTTRSALPPAASRGSRPDSTPSGSASGGFRGHGSASRRSSSLATASPMPPATRLPPHARARDDDERGREDLLPGRSRSRGGRPARPARPRARARARRRGRRSNGVLGHPGGGLLGSSPSGTAWSPERISPPTSRAGRTRPGGLRRNTRVEPAGSRTSPRCSSGCPAPGAARGGPCARARRRPVRRQHRGAYDEPRRSSTRRETPACSPPAWGSARETSSPVSTCT